MRNARRKKTEELRASLEHTAEKKPDTVTKKAARKIGSALGTVAAATHIGGPKSKQAG